jgi:hypothetical protein
MGPILSQNVRKKSLWYGVLSIVLGLIIVVWILKHTARMSRDIHDDHSSFWVSVDSSKLNEWYDTHDVCLLSSPAAAPYSHHSVSQRRHNHSSDHRGTLQSSHADLQIQRKILKNMEMNWSNSCAMESRTAMREAGHTRNNVPSFCRLSNCDLPLAARLFHRKELNSKVIKNLPRKSLIGYLYHMAEAEHALVFIGDSVTKQVLRGKPF